MNIDIRKRTLLGALALGLAALAPAAFGQTYPNKPVRVIVPYAPGGTVDTVARMLSQRLSEQMGQPFVVENRAGANGAIGSDVVAKSPADGYTLLMQASTFVAAALLVKSQPYDIDKDFTPIANLGSVPLVMLVYPGLPMKNLSDFIAAARAEPKKYTLGTAAFGSASHLAEEAIRHEAKLDVQIIPYKGTTPAMVDVLGGHTTGMIDALPSLMQHIRSGKARALAVTSARRLPSLPEVPTVAESGLPNFEMVSWYGIWAPANMPADLAARLNREINAAMQSPQVQQGLGAQAFIFNNTSGTQFGNYVRQESAKYKQLIEKANIKID
ncbi:MAG: tripartite tricarboxylate transporter substrate binding protein [Polaromonas sp.]|nr:tripartite tricarboxylate transporter substrate binding protein [Polaromonas sp.]